MEKKRNLTKVIGYILVVLLVVSTVGFILAYNPQDVERVKGYKFTRGTEFVKSKIDGNEYLFRFMPSELAELPSNGQVKALLENTRTMYMAYDFNSSAAQELAFVEYNLIEEFNRLHPDLYVLPASIGPNTYALPEVACANATTLVPVMLFEQGNATGIYVNNSCITAIYQDATEAIVLRDLVLYNAMGVLP